jgi:hypothetical protein
VDLVAHDRRQQPARERPRVVDHAADLRLVDDRPGGAAYQRLDLPRVVGQQRPRYPQTQPLGQRELVRLELAGGVDVRAVDPLAVGGPQDAADRLHRLLAGEQLLRLGHVRPEVESGRAAVPDARELVESQLPVTVAQEPPLAVEVRGRHRQPAREVTQIQPGHLGAPLGHGLDDGIDRRIEILGQDEDS